jgi:LAO/AO transport system kinase
VGQGRAVSNGLVERVLAGDRRALARIITLIENNNPAAREHLARLHQHTGRAHVIGITGSPGAGKSTLVTQIVRELRRRDRRIGVVAVDPTSPFTGGALLGDRIRMQELAGDPNVFIRSMASRGQLGGLAAATHDVVRAMDAASYDVVIVETVGTGQAEVEIVRTAQTVAVVVVPGMGDGIQAIKAGILEIADIFVINKADRPGAGQTAAELRILMHLEPKAEANAWHIPILQTVATERTGIAELVDAMEAHRRYLEQSGHLASRLNRQVRSEVLHLVEQQAFQKLTSAVTDDEWDRLVASVVDLRSDPYTLAAQLAQRIGLRAADENA